jgi:hypothetical protein
MEVLAFGLPLAAPFVIAALRHSGGHLTAAGTVLVSTATGILASWWLLWPALFWLNGWLGQHSW